MKKIKKDIFIILGGAQVTMHIKRFIENKTLLDFIDGFVIHEGEIPICNLITNLKSKKYLNYLIPNFYYKDGSVYRSSQDINFTMPINEYQTPDFRGFDLKSYSQFLLPIRTLRGCFWGRCRFCSNPYNNRKFELTKPEFVVDSIKRLQKKYKIDRFEFIDSTLPANFLQQIAQLIIKRNLNVKWTCRINIQKDFQDIELVRLLRESGCESLSLGVESGNNRIIQFMDKIQKDKNAVLEVIKSLTSQNIIPIIFIMIGFPTETKHELEETIAFAMKLKIEFRCALENVSVFNLLEHTYVFNNLEEFKIQRISKESYLGYQGYGYKFETSEGLNRKDIYRMYRKARFFIKYPWLYRMLHH